MSEENFAVLLGSLAVVVLILSLLISVGITGLVTLGEIGNGPATPSIDNIDSVELDEDYSSGGGASNGGNSGINVDIGGDGVVEIKFLCQRKSECEFGEKECTANGYRECKDTDNDGCFEWVNKGCKSGEQCLEDRGECIAVCTENDWSFNLSPNICPSNGKQTKTWQKTGSCVGGVQKISEEQVSCTYQAPVCDSGGFIYSSWSECESNGKQTRTVSGKGPAGCEGGNPIVVRNCVYVPECSEDNWERFDSVCRKEKKLTRAWSKVGSCVNGVQKISEEQVSCTYQAPVCNSFSYSDWSSCSKEGIITRAVSGKGPAGCEGGNPLIQEVCTYIPPCTRGQIVSCGSVENGRFEGHKDICKIDQSGWKGENNCNVICDSGFEKNGDKCLKIEIAESYDNELDSSEVYFEAVEENVEIVKDSVSKTELVKIIGKEVNTESLEIKRAKLVEEREYKIIKNLNLEIGESKEVIIEKKKVESNGVCLADREEIESLEDILDSCRKLACPGKISRYECKLGDNNEFIVSGLRFSGVVEDVLSCGDSVCSVEIGESCASCSNDCGVCENTREEPRAEERAKEENKISNIVIGGGNIGNSGVASEEKTGDVAGENNLGSLEKSEFLKNDDVESESSGFLGKIKENPIFVVLSIIVFLVLIVFVVLIKILKKDQRVENNGNFESVRMEVNGLD